MPSQTKEKPKKVEIVVESDNHTHKGKPCKRDDKIKVSKETAEMLKASWKKRAEKEKNKA